MAYEINEFQSCLYIRAVWSGRFMFVDILDSIHWIFKQVMKTGNAEQMRLLV